MSCNIFPELSNVSGYIDVITELKTHNPTQIKNGLINFDLLENTVALQVKLEEKSEGICLYTVYTQWFINQEKYEDQKRNFVFYLLKLLGFCFVSVPLVIYYLKEIVKNRKKEKIIN